MNDAHKELKKAYGLIDQKGVSKKNAVFKLVESETGARLLYKSMLNGCESKRLLEKLSAPDFKKHCSSVKSALRSHCFKKKLKEAKIETAAGMSYYAGVAVRLGKQDKEIDVNYATVLAINNALEVLNKLASKSHILSGFVQKKERIKGEAALAKAHELETFNKAKRTVLTKCRELYVIEKKRLGASSGKKKKWLTKALSMLDKKFKSIEKQSLKI